MSTTSPAGTSPTEPAAFWEQRYRDSDRVWSGNPNPLLVRETSGLRPGRALDLGCGEGADAVWLAGQGWQVVGVDISATALTRAAAHAGQAGVADRVTWERHELGIGFPEGRFDLVNAQFLQSPVALDQDGVLRRAAAAVAPGGTLLIVMHAEWPTWMTPEEYPFDAEFPTRDGVLRSLNLSGDWTTVTLEAVERAITAPDGREGTRADNVWRLTRAADARD
ncbi:class I SAM-dependent methyltransferase [Nocardia nova]|uniref:class I SAM-dependent methyltransferase n=1 Tax=Nocardia nova TaxID=37330 RepID=UPI0033E38919